MFVKALYMLILLFYTSPLVKGGSIGFLFAICVRYNLGVYGKLRIGNLVPYIHSFLFTCMFIRESLNLNLKMTGRGLGGSNFPQIISGSLGSSFMFNCPSDTVDPLGSIKRLGVTSFF